MNPNQPKENRIITIKNIDSEPFEVVYSGQLWAHLEPGQIVTLPETPYATHAIKHLTDQVLNRADIRLNNETERRRVEDLIVIDAKTLAAPEQLSDIEEKRMEIEELNKNINIDAIMARKTQEQNPQPAPAPAFQAQSTSVPVPPVNPAPQPQPQVTAQPAPQPTAPENPPAPQETIDPERAKVYTYAENVLKMQLTDPKTKAAMDAKSVEELKQELNYEEPEDLNLELNQHPDEFHVTNA